MSQGKYPPPTALNKLREQMEIARVKFASLDAYRPSASDELRGLCNGHRKPTLGNIASIAEAVCELVANPVTASEPRERVAVFWRKYRRVLPGANHLPDLPDTGELTPLLLEACGLNPAHADDSDLAHPFCHRSGIRDTRAFFGRERELRDLRNFLNNNQNAQIIGPRRIGKTSLLNRIGVWIGEQFGTAVYTFVDMQNPQPQTLRGFFNLVARGWGWNEAPKDCVDFSTAIDSAVSQRRRLVLALDECDKFIELGMEFPAAFFDMLRSDSQKGPGGRVGLTILTASKLPLREIFQRGGIISPSHNTYHPLHLGPFPEREARAFVTLDRTGTPKFSPEEVTAVLELARGHPLILQMACYEGAMAKQDGESFWAALEGVRSKAAELMPESSKSR